LKIKYKTDGRLCKTFCPDKKNKAKVSSFSCHNCDYFVSDDAEKKIVECSFKDNK